MSDFNPKKPYNNLPFLPPKVDYNSLKIIKQLMKAKIELAKLDTLTKNKLDNKEMFLEPFAIRESVESSQIENINTTFETAYKSEYEAKVNPEQKETMAYKEALLHGYELIKKNGFLGTNHIFEIGDILSPSKWIKRTSPGVCIKKSDWSGEEILYTPPIWQNKNWKDAIDDLLVNLEHFFNTPSDEIDPLIQMALIHYQFEAIHPFYDGNGRTGRVLMMLHLISHGQLCYPVLFISSFINKTKSDYYELLKNVTHNWERENFIMYILKAVEEQSKNTLKITEKFIEYKEWIRITLSNVDSLKTKDAECIYQLLSSRTYFSMNDLRNTSWVSINTWTKLFKIIVENWLGKEKKIWKNKVIFNEDFLKIFNK
jgi:Fic family protein